LVGDIWVDLYGILWGSCVVTRITPINRATWLVP